MKLFFLFIILFFSSNIYLSDLIDSNLLNQKIEQLQETINLERIKALEEVEEEGFEELSKLRKSSKFPSLFDMNDQEKIASFNKLKKDLLILEAEPNLLELICKESIIGRIKAFIFDDELKEILLKISEQLRDCDDYGAVIDLLINEIKKKMNQYEKNKKESEKTENISEIDIQYYNIEKLLSDLIELKDEIINRKEILLQRLNQMYQEAKSINKIIKEANIKLRKKNVPGCKSDLTILIEMELEQILNKY